MRNPIFCMFVNKVPDQLHSNCEGNHTFVFATEIVQFLYILNLKFPVSSNLLCLYSSVCVGPDWKTRWFSHEATHLVSGFNAPRELIVNRIHTYFQIKHGRMLILNKVFLFNKTIG